MKSVAIIGAGPAGIIAARKLLQAQQFTVTIFEKADSAGGSWIPGGIINPEMRTNQSKFTMCFSDLSWESLDIDDRPVPIHPKARDVFQYLRAYNERYIPEEMVHFGTTVTNVEHISHEASHDGPRWNLRLCKHTEAAEAVIWEETFDLLVAAPGIYNIPKKLTLSPHTKGLQESAVPIIHSTRYRTLKDLGPALNFVTSGKRRVLVVGGSHSGAEVADLVARQLSDAQYSPASSGTHSNAWEDIEVTHVSSHEMFGLPAVIRDMSANSCAFQPIDFTLFNRSSRPSYPPPSFLFGLLTLEKIVGSRKMIHKIQDGDEGTLDARHFDQLAPVAVLSDTYLQFVKTGQIIQVRGRLQELEATGTNSLLTATIGGLTVKDSLVIENVCAVIYATGFDPVTSLSFLSEPTKRALGFDSSCAQAPILLDTNFLSQNSSLPTFAMVGFPGAYWGFFEMQARAIVQAWTKKHELGRVPMRLSQDEKLLEFYHSLRRAVKDGRKSEVPNNPFGDNVGALEQASRELGLERFDLGSSESEGFVCPSRYLDPESDKLEAMATLTAAQHTQRQARNSGLFIARASFLGLLGDWVAAKREKNGDVNVIRQSFHWRYPTNPSFCWEYLSSWTENGNTSWSVYRYTEIDDSLTIWTVKENELIADRLAGTFDFNNAAQERGKDTAVAVFIPVENASNDIEGLDVYRLQFAGSSLKTWTVGRAGAGATSMHFIRIGSV